MKLILSAATAIVALITTTIAAPAPEGFTLEKRGKLPYEFHRV